MAVRFKHSGALGDLFYCLPVVRALAGPEGGDVLLNTGRGTSAQWHTGSRTDKSEVLRKLYPAAPYIELHPDDAARLGIADASPVSVRSRRSSFPICSVCRRRS